MVGTHSYIGTRITYYAVFRAYEEEGRPNEIPLYLEPWMGPTPSEPVDSDFTQKQTDRGIRKRFSRT